MRVAMAVESTTAEAAIGHALACRDETSIRAARYLAKEAGAAIASPHKSHRYRGNRGGTHHGQEDAA
jgi:hypothetical protein